MNDSFINALNTQKASISWMDAITENLANIYTPGTEKTKQRLKHS